jgi:hypothetical protein
MTMRKLSDDRGDAWEAIAIPTKVAHLRDGARLAFRRSDPDTSVPTDIDFNSVAAAELGIRSMSESELLRRLTWARTASGVA